MASKSKRLRDMDMPKSEAASEFDALSDESMEDESAEDDLMADDAEAEMDDMEEMPEVDNPLADFTDDELMAELEARGLSTKLDSTSEDEEMMDEAEDEEY